MSIKTEIWAIKITTKLLSAEIKIKVMKSRNLLNSVQKKTFMEIINIHSKKKMYLSMTMKPTSKNLIAANTTNMTIKHKTTMHTNPHQDTN